MSSLIELPEKYRKMSDEECIKIIQNKKKELGPELAILVHHYQRKEIVPFHDFIGDSFALSANAAKQKEVKYIVFCGVHFMAESADIVSREDQTVYLPNPYAGCPMADMAPYHQVEKAWKELATVTDSSKVIPISYMNSTARMKAFTGVNNGLICTSSNADKAFDYAFNHGEKIFFFPDQHLGRNTARAKRIDPRQVLLWDNQKPLGGYSEEDIERAKVILWNGHCHVHMNFSLEQIDRRRSQMPDIKIIVHPECREEVVSAADAYGSTKFIVNYVKDAKPGSKIAIATELNLVSRLMDEYPDKEIMALSEDICPMCVNMYRTTLNDLAFTLDVMQDGGGNVITVDEPYRSEAMLALNKMLELE